MGNQLSSSDDKITAVDIVGVLILIVLFIAALGVGIGLFIRAIRWGAGF